MIKAVINIPLIGWVRRLSVQSKLSIITGLMILLLVLGLGEFAFGMKVMSGIRAYVGGEGLWSKAQKSAINHLIAYSASFNEAHYQRFMSALQVTLGDKRARLELEKDVPDLAITRQGFIAGGNHPEDVDDLIFLYRWFRHVSYMSRAIDVWAEGDAEIERLLRVGDEMHTLISTSRGSVDRTVLSPQIVSLLGRVDISDQKLTVLENRFSATLGEGSRRIYDILFWVILFVTAVLGAFVIFIELLIKKTVVEVDTAKSEFVSLASHQLRTPPTAIAWITERLLGGKVGELNNKQKEYFEDIRRSNQRIIELVNALLNVSRIELGVFKVEPVPADIKVLVRGLVEEVKIMLAAKRLKLREKYAAQSLVIPVDVDLFRTVIQNLLINAINYTPEGGEITVEVSLGHKGEVFGGRKIEENSCLVRVSDTGYGIPQDQQDKIFTKLFRADNVKKKHTDGTGLGLYIVKSILDPSGGSIQFTSAENKGSTFLVTIPPSGMRPWAGTKSLTSPALPK